MAQVNWASLGESYSSAETQSVYSMAQVNWASLGESYSSAETQSVYPTASANWVKKERMKGKKKTKKELVQKKDKKR